LTFEFSGMNDIFAGGQGKPCPYNTLDIIVGTPLLASETQTFTPDV